MYSFILQFSAMKTPCNNAIIYDDNCPLCTAYTNGFVKTGLIKKENRLAFSQVSTARYNIDWQKARHEIPVIDIDSGNIYYGVDALVTVLRQKIPFIAGLLKIKMFNWFIKKLYSFISYNRRIIVAKIETPGEGFNCAPDYNFTYRFLLIAVTFTLAGMLLYNQFSNTLLNIIYLPMILAFAITLIKKDKRLFADIFAHLGLSALIFSFSLSFFTIVKNLFLAPHPVFSIIVISMSVALFIQQIHRRIKYIKHHHHLKQ